MDLEEAELALDDLERRPHIGRLQSDVCAPENFVAWRHFDEQFRHSRDRHVALASRSDVRRSLGLHAVDEGVGAKLKIHASAHGDAERGDQFRMRIADSADAEVIADDLGRAWDAYGSADKMHGFDPSRSGLLAD